LPSSSIRSPFAERAGDLLWVLVSTVGAQDVDETISIQRDVIDTLPGHLHVHLHVDLLPRSLTYSSGFSLAIDL
jgi:hypothetical protein